ncbi:hypothetical protein [Pseudalkalibacillus caeni]|uniref:hypothetical protein n=1 Tax=Exobacillus caeni TaxID=2574798 RepID=UPI001485A5F1|nr:hypothetical protein [Pseudalkalibacillus caeni]
MSKKKFFVIVLFLALSVVMISNYQLFKHTKQLCVENSKIPHGEKGFLAINWSVTCE